MSTFINEDEIIDSIFNYPKNFRKLIKRYQIYNFDKFPNKVMLNFVWNFLEGSDDKIKYDEYIAILIDNFGPNFLAYKEPDFEDKNVLEYVSSYINKHPSISDQKIQEIFDILLFGHEYMIKQTKIIDYTKKINNKRVTEILEEIYLKNSESQLKIQKESFSKIHDQLNIYDFQDYLINHKVKRIVHRLYKLIREERNKEYEKFIKEISKDDKILSNLIIKEIDLIKGIIQV